ncbi:MAG TPA: hypothetical protein VEK57_12230 [Thermoanaerobaculia bacterium]|nr:hypothetical protein [Thermoanaerobaculia bacterium]
MNDPIANYSFLPWLRHGLANQIGPDAFEGARATMNVSLRVEGDRLDGTGTDVSPDVVQNVALFGPGDIQGIESRAIVRVEPRNWVTNFEPNYLPAIEFYDEDFVWRYTPEAPVNGRLRPWLALVVLAEGEFEEGKNVKDKPLGYVDVKTLDVFPSFDQLWAWAHVHVNRNLIDDKVVFDDMNVVLPRLQSVLQENPDHAYSRLVSSRRLLPKTGYHAFLMPAYESGRRAGLGLDPGGAGPTVSAWDSSSNGSEGSHFPYYYRWYFRTAEAGDFETLVRLLEPKPADFRVGTRDLDVQRPGIKIRGVENKPELGGVLKLGGALRVPRAGFEGEEKKKLEMYEQWAEPFPQPMQEDLARRVNLAEDYAGQPASVANAAAKITDPDNPGDPDPVVTLPLYGTWHARTKRLLDSGASNDWLHELNLDPRFRVAAGFGTRVVQENQETYMDAAWSQVGRIVEANQRIRFGQFSQAVSTVWYDAHIKPLVAVKQEKGFVLIAPLKKRVRDGKATVQQHLRESHVQPVLTSGAMRRVLRPRGRLMRSLPFNGKQTPDNLLHRVNEGEVSAAPPRGTPPPLPAVNELADKLLPNVPAWLIDLIRHYPNLIWWLLLFIAVLIVLLFLLAPPPVAVAAAIVLVVVAIVLFVWWMWLYWWIRAADSIREENQTHPKVNRLPKSPGFRIVPIGDTQRWPGGADNDEAKDFKEGLKRAFDLIGESGKVSHKPPKEKLDLPGLVDTMVAALDPGTTIPARILGTIVLPGHVQAEKGEGFVEAMVYPELNMPMYKPLNGISSELFVPNLHQIAENSVTLLETNQKFIESYMVGLNHEFGRELLWRQFPTDQRGSYFRQFWDPGGHLDTGGLDPEALKEKLYDIPKLHLWPKSSNLGDHDHREKGASEEEVVLVIRGELLKRYPNPVIFAQRARWQEKPKGTIDLKAERRLVELTAVDGQIPSHEEVRTPLYEAHVSPDITFFGFDLTVTEAVGGSGTKDNDPGWFFVIKERPGEPRFGLDTGKQPKLHVWNDLSWGDVQLLNDRHVNVDVPPAGLIEPVDPSDEEKLPQHEEDAKIVWNEAVTSAHLAYILFQAPVRVAFHASEMLGG